MAKHLTLVPPPASSPPEPNPDTVRMLRDLLKRAEVGALRSFAWAGLDDDLFCYDSVIEPGDEASLYLALHQAADVIR